MKNPPKRALQVIHLRWDRLETAPDKGFSDLRPAKLRKTIEILHPECTQLYGRTLR
jgi:hypothetical protein